MKIGRFALEGISFDVADSECLALVGPNGSGKTTLLECIAGVRQIESGRIQLNGVDVTHLVPEKRQVGYVPQDCLLFPHLTVDQNIAFGQRRPSGNGKDRAKEMMEWLGISHLGGRHTKSLSWGEKQKVALTRALITRPRVLLLDEPFSSVDRVSRRKLLGEMRKSLDEVSRTLGLASVYVTHDLAEAQLMTSEVAIMNNGRIEQVGSWERVLQTPSSTFVADFMGFNTLQGTLTSTDDGYAVAQADGRTIRGVASELRVGEPVIIVVRPEAISLSLGRNNGKPHWRHCECNVFQGSVKGMRKMGSLTQVSIDVGFPLNVEMSSDTVDELNLAVGTSVFAHFRASEVSFLRA